MTALLSQNCCFCTTSFNGFGNNPSPLMTTGRCCDTCNLTRVIPFRLGMGVVVPEDDNETRMAEYAVAYGEYCSERVNNHLVWFTFDFLFNWENHYSDLLHTAISLLPDPDDQQRAMESLVDKRDVLVRFVENEENVREWIQEYLVEENAFVRENAGEDDLEEIAEYIVKYNDTHGVG